MRSSIIGIAILCVFALNGCGTGERKRLEGDLAQARARISELDSTLALTRVSTDSLADSLSAVVLAIRRSQSKSESLQASYQTVAAKSKRLEKDLRTARTEFQRALDSLQFIRADLDNKVRTQNERLASAEAQLTSTQQEIEQVTGQRDSVLGLIEHTRPWLDYYKQEAKRNWVKKLFGAGRAKKPPTPEPALVPVSAPRLKVEEPS